MTSTAAEPSRAPASPVWLDRRTPPHVITLVAMTGVSALNMNMMLPSLPSLAEYFGADYAVVALAVSAYLAMTAALQVVLGPLSDRYGRRPVTLGCFAVFLLATLGCMLSPSIEVFLGFRMLQAAVASAFAISRAVVRDMVPADQAASLIGYITMGMSLVPMVAPMLGGFLDEHFGWQSVFLVTLIAGVGVTALIWADMGETNRTQSSSFAAQFRAYPELFRSHRFWGYALTALLQLAIGPLSDRYGRRPVMIGCFAIFLVATVGCMLAPSIEVFLGFRMAQATVASAFALSRAIVRDMVGPDEAASLIGYVTMGMSVAPMVSPMIGGYLDEHFGWQSVFAFTLVAGGVATALMWADMGETNAAPSSSVLAQFRA
jgi:MFS family permease